MQLLLGFFFIGSWSVPLCKSPLSCKDHTLSLRQNQFYKQGPDYSLRQLRKLPPCPWSLPGVPFEMFWYIFRFPSRCPLLLRRNCLALDNEAWIRHPSNWITIPSWCGNGATWMHRLLHFRDLQTLHIISNGSEGLVITRARFFYLCDHVCLILDNL